ncbi:MAG: hypothetical protein ACRDIZ_00490 [Actinomycetota bacterium]
MATARPEAPYTPSRTEAVRFLRSPLPVAVALASLMAGGIHLGAADVHLEEWPLSSAFFLTAGAAQAAWAALVLDRPRRRLLVAGMAANGLVALVWVASRTTGLPIGPHPWEPEAVGVADALASAFEVVSVVGAAALLGGRRTAGGAGAPSRSLPPALSASFGVLAATVAAAAWAPLIAAGHHGEAAAHASLSHLVALGAMVASVVAVASAAIRFRPPGRLTERRSA